MKYAYRFLVGPSVVTLLAAASLACGSSKGSGFGTDGSSSSGGSGSSGGSSGGLGSGSSGGGSGSSGSFGDAAPPPPSGDSGAGSNCTVGAGKYIYVVSDMNELYTFDPTLFPSASAFKDVGMVPCVSGGGYVNSMAIDRQANAYINIHPDGTIMKLTTTAPVTCTPTGFTSGQSMFSGDLGMGFAADSKGAATDTLYVSDNSGPLGVCTASTPTMGSCWGLGLGKVDLNSWTLTPLGAYTASAAGYNAELTGTGNGDLYGFFTTTPSSYGPIDKTNGHTDSPAPTVETSVMVAMGGYAFSFWGGDFYFYTAPSGNTVPQHLSTSTMTVTAGDMLSFVIVGAGVSTCAPVTPPQ
jgi:hypothetical protein